jgi:hypothetical protein
MPPVVVVASIQAPLRALSGVPIRLIANRQLPGGSRAVLERDPSDPQSPGEVRRDSIVSASPVQGAGERAPVSAVSEPVLSADGASASLPGGPASEVLASTSIAVPMLLQPMSDSRVPERGPDPVSTAATAPGIGTSASRISVATAAVASRAGMSVGRFFKNGGLAVANRF